MIRTTVGILALVLVTAVAFADDKVKKPVGTWTREAGDMKITFAIKADKMTVTFHGPNGDLVVVSSYEVPKEGEVKGKIDNIEKNDVGAGVEEGHKYSFRYKIADGTLTISELKGNDGNDADEGAKQLVEGEYKKVKEEKKEEKKDK